MKCRYFLIYYILFFSFFFFCQRDLKLLRNPSRTCRQEVVDGASSYFFACETVRTIRIERSSEGNRLHKSFFFLTLRPYDCLTNTRLRLRVAKYFLTMKYKIYMYWLFTIYRMTIRVFEKKKHYIICSVMIKFVS